MKRKNPIKSLKSISQKIVKNDISAVTGISSCLPVLIKSDANEQWAHTQSTLCNIKFNWIIDNYSFRQGQVGTPIESPTFLSNVNDEIKWRLRLFPNGDCQEKKDYMSIYLQIVSEPRSKSKVMAKFKFSILHSGPTIIGSKFSEAKNFENMKSWGFSGFIERSILLDKTCGNLPDDKLTIVCEVSYVSDSIDISSQMNIGQFNVPECKITNHFANLLKSQEFSDVTLVVGEYEFPAHKAILAARSDVFAAMFRHEMEENRSGRVSISDVSQAVLQEMLHFIYTEEAPKLKEMASHLLVAADKYALQKLKVMSEEALFRELSIERAVETLILADLHSADQLKEKTIHFITAHAKDIIQTKGWQNLKNANALSALMGEASEALLTKPKLST